jgi:ring-1,2-phenylacetyl-CoA epoxidase subunit PaaE
MADIVKSTLLERGIESKQIHTEVFANAHHVPGDISATSATGNTVIVHLNGKRIEIQVPDGATILDVLVKAKYEPPYSCTSGACSTCMAKVISGKVTMDACYALDDDEVKDGYILTCQSHPQTPVVELTYDM